MKFLKSFGFGLLYIVLLPFILVGIALIAVYAVVVFFIEFVIMLINFFSGKKLFPPFEEDVKAQKIIQNQLDAKLNPQPAPTPQPQTVFVQQNYYTSPPNQPQQAIAQQNQQPFPQPFPQGQTIAQNQGEAQQIQSTPTPIEVQPVNEQISFNPDSLPSLEDDPSVPLIESKGDNDD